MDLRQKLLFSVTGKLRNTPKLAVGVEIELTKNQTLPLLDRLKGNRTRFLTRSVANHLIDITKNRHQGL